ncbi:MAG: cysteine desulfurase [Candidatus Micrarchaeota archaeon]|nr:cysteine desulfurase [Candidatus Micrarchaeota archaeon]
MIYLDYAATTPVRNEVIEAMKPFFSDTFGNPSSIHLPGTEAREAVEKSRESILEHIKGRGRLVFTSGGTEANNLAIKGVCLSRKKGHVLVSSIEHPCIMETARWLSSMGWKVDHIPVDRYGLVDPGTVEDMIRDDTVLVSVMHANNEIGTVEPVEEISKICSEKGVLFHTDAVQTLGKIEVDLRKIDADMVSFSSHKIYGPKGVGALFVKEDVKLVPLLHGGGQEFGLRSGTENVPGIVGFSKAVELAVKELPEEAERLRKLRDELISGLLEIPETFLNGHPEKRLPNNVHVCFRFIEGESIVLMLSEKGVFVSTASACSSRKLEPSHVLRAIGLNHRDAHGSVRFTLGKFTKREDIEKTIEVCAEVVEKLRKISPFTE